MPRWIVVDVEAGGGPTPITGTMTEFGAVETITGEWFHGKIWDAKPLESNPAVPDMRTAVRVAKEHDVMVAFREWLYSWNDRVVLVSDNPAYDAMWIACAFDAYNIANPFGHSARRIGDFAAGLSGRWKNTSEWKKLRDTRHDHNPVNDAMGNVEALRKLLGQAD